MCKGVYWKAMILALGLSFSIPSFALEMEFPLPASTSQDDSDQGDLTGCVPSREEVEVQILSLGDVISRLREDAGAPPEKVECVKDIDDLYDPGAVMHYGLNDGKCIDATNLRAPHVIEDTPEKLVIANFRHGRQWWIAEIPKDGIQKVHMQTAEFEAPLPIMKFAHAQFRFVMKPGMKVKLRSQHYGKERISDVDSFVISSEPIYAVKGVYEDGFLERGFFGNDYGIVTGFGSTEERGIFDLIQQNRRVEQTELKLDDAQKAHLLSVAASTAQERGYKRAYNAIDQNCATEMFDTLDRAYPPKGDVSSMEVTLGRMFDPVVGPARQALIDRGFAEESTPITLFNDEAQGGRLLIDKMLKDTPYTELRRLPLTEIQERFRPARAEAPGTNP